jgi:hypothetical protein
MNSDMDNNSDTLYSRLIAWLLEESVPAASSPADGQAQSTVPSGEQKAADFELEQLDPLDSEELNIASSITSQAAQDHAWAGFKRIRNPHRNPTRRTNPPLQLGRNTDRGKPFPGTIKAPIAN